MVFPRWSFDLKLRSVFFFVVSLGLISLLIFSSGLFSVKAASEGDYVRTTLWDTTAGIYAYQVDSDADGNVYIGGDFYGTIDMNNTAGVDNRTSVGSADIFITKYDSNRNYLWTKVIGGTSGYDGITSLVVDASGIYFTGRFGGTVDFDPNAGTDNKSSGGGGGNGFVSKYNLDGTYAWTRILSSGASNGSYLAKLKIYSSNLYLVGQYTGTADFNDTPSQNNYFTANAYADGAVIKYDLNGNYVWGRSWYLSGSSDENFQAVAVTANGVYAMGMWGNNSGHMVKYDLNGNSPVTSSMTNRCNGCNVVDDGSNLYVFGSGTYNAMIFLDKYNSAGSLLWSRSTGASGDDSARGIDIDGSNLYVTGNFDGSFDLDLTAGTDNRTASNTDAFLSKYTTSGTYGWTRSWGGASSDSPNTINVRSSAEVDVVGKCLSYSVDFDGTAGTDTKSCSTAGYSFLTTYSLLNGTLITNVPAGLTATLSSDWTTNVASASQSGINNIGIKKGTGKITSFNVDFSASRDWANVVADTANYKSILGYSGGNFTNIPGRNSATYTLYVPKSAGGIRVGFCPSASVLADVTTTCSGVSYINDGASGTVGSDTVSVATGAGMYSGYWVITGLSVKMGAFDSEGYVVQTTTVPVNTNIVLTSSPETDLTTTPVTGTQTVTIKSTATTNSIADIPLDFSSDINLSTLTVGAQGNISFVHVPGGITNLPGVPALSTYTLYVPKGSGTQVRVCPGASSLTEVSPNCSGGYTLSDGQSYAGATATVEGGFWKISGLTSTGAMSLLSGTLSDTLTRQAVSTAANHEITFGTNYGVAFGENFTLEFDPTVHAFDFGSVGVTDIELTDALATVYTLAGTAGSGVWGVTIASDVITFTAPTGGTGNIVGASQVIVRIGTNVTGGVNQISNPASAGSYRLLITLNTANSEEGEVAIPIVDSDQVNVTGYVNTFINFDIDTSVVDDDCEYNNCLTHENGSAGANYTVDLGELNSAWVNASNGTAVMHTQGGSGVINSIYFNLTTNAYGGAILYVTSANSGLQGPATNVIASVATDGDDLVANSGLYGFQLPVAGSGNGTVDRGTACISGVDYCSLTSTANVVFDTEGAPLDGGRLRMDIAAAAAYTNNPGTYTDTLTFIVVPTY